MKSKELAERATELAKRNDLNTIEGEIAARLRPGLRSRLLKGKVARKGKTKLLYHPTFVMTVLKLQQKLCKNGKPKKNLQDLPELAAAILSVEVHSGLALWILAWLIKKGLLQFCAMYPAIHKGGSDRA